MSFSPGSAVMVQWSDGNQYSAQVADHQNGHVLVSFAGGQQQWVPEHQVIPSGPPAGAPIPLDDYTRRELAELQETIRRVESQAVPLAGVDPNDPVTMWTQVLALDRLEQQGVPRDQGAQQLGFAGGEHFDLIMRYVRAKWSTLGTDDEGRPAVVLRDEYNNAAAQASMGQMQAAQAAAAGADPNLLAPVAGVSIEQWARAAVMLGSLGGGATVDQVAHKLAELGLDKATYEAATEGWMAKMQGDTTGVISTKYAEAFMQAQSGATATTPGGDGDAPPCTFERYVEISAAMGCWADQGFDTNAKVKEVFGVDAMGFSRYATYWGMKMTSDLSLFSQQEQLDAKFRQKYAGADLDADLVL